jgi:hypothetical protein
MPSELMPRRALPKRISLAKAAVEVRCGFAGFAGAVGEGILGPA